MPTSLATTATTPCSGLSRRGSGGERRDLRRSTRITLLFDAWIARRLVFSWRRDIRADELLHEVADRSCMERVADELSGCLRDGSAGKGGTDRRIAQPGLLGEVVLAHTTKSELVSQAISVKPNTHCAFPPLPR